jgi:nucleoside-diphosphate-sugar epimerase
MKRILITGGLGFLGSYCIEKYKKEGYDITIIDNLSSNVIGVDDDICNGCKVIINDIIEHNWDDGNQYDVILHLLHCNEFLK